MSIHKYSLNTVEHQASTARRPRVTIAQLLLRAVQRWQRNRAIAALQRLDDRYLQKIGVMRNDIPKLTEELFEPSDRRKAASSKMPPMIDRQLQQSA